MIRAQLMVVANEPKMALEDIKEVLKDEPEDFLAICTKVVIYTFLLYNISSYQAKCMFLVGDFEKSLVVWHKAKQLRGNTTEVWK